MAAITVNNLPDANLPILGTDKTVVSRDGTILNDISITDVNAGLTPTMNTATPNATVPVEALVATNSNGTFANIDVAIVPKGTGAFSLQVADNAITGGNKRGGNSVDLQTVRNSATQVTSGALSFAAGYWNTVSADGACAIGFNNISSGAQSVALGRSNTASNQQSVAIGLSNTASGAGSFVAGQNNTVSGINSAAIGLQQSVINSSSCAIGENNSVSGLAAGAFGSSNTASGTTSFAIGRLNMATADRSLAIGISNNATGLASSIPGGANATTNGIQGQVAFGHNSDALGRYQTTLTGLRQVTTGTTATRATADGATAATANQLTLRNNSVFKFMGRVVAYDLTTLDAKEWEFSGLIKRGANAAATSLVGTPSVTSQFADTAASAWMVAVSADTTNGALAVTVTGAGANQIRWYVEVFAYETGV